MGSKFRPTFAREAKRRTRTRVSAVTERRRARRAAKATCRAEQRRIRTAIPDERKRVDGVIKQIRASARQAAAQVIAQGAEAVRIERDDLRKRIAGWRKDAKLGRCVDMTAGPQIFAYAYPKKPPHLKRGGQPPLFSNVPAPIHGGGKLGDPYRVRGQQHSSEKRALAAVLAHLVHDQGGIVVLEQWDGRQYVDGPMYGLEGEGKAAKLVELDPLDPHGHNVGRAQKHSQFGAGLRSILPSTKPPPAAAPSARRSSLPPAPTGAMIAGRAYGKGSYVVMGSIVRPQEAMRNAKGQQLSGGFPVLVVGLERGANSLRVRDDKGRVFETGADRVVVVSDKEQVEYARALGHRSPGEIYELAPRKRKQSPDARPVKLTRGRNPTSPSARPVKVTRGRKPKPKAAPKRGRKGYSTMPPRHSSAPPAPKKKSVAPPSVGGSKAPAARYSEAEQRRARAAYHPKATDTGERARVYVGSRLIGEGSIFADADGTHAIRDDSGKVLASADRTGGYQATIHDASGPAYVPASVEVIDAAPPAKRASAPPAPKAAANRSRVPGAGTRPQYAGAPDPRPSWGHEWGALGFKVKWAQPSDPITSGGIYGEEARPYWSVQWSLNEALQFRHGQYGWQLREKAGKVELHVKPHNYWSTIGDVDALTFGELYAGCVKRYYMSSKELRQAEGEYKPKRRTKATLPTTRIPSQGAVPSVAEVLSGARRVTAGSLSKVDAGAEKLIRRTFDGEGPYYVYFEDGKGDRNVVAKRKTLNGAKSAAQSLASKYAQPKIYGWFMAPEKGWSDVHVTDTKAGTRRFWIGR